MAETPETSWVDKVGKAAIVAAGIQAAACVPITPGKYEGEDFRDKPVDFLLENKADLQGVDLSGRQDLAGQDWSEAQFDRADLRANNFRDSDLVDASLRDSDARGADFSQADLTDAQAFNIDARGASFYLSTLDNADFSYAQLQGSDMGFVNARYTDFSNAQLQSVILEGVDLSDARLYGADVAQATFIGVTLPDDLYGVKNLDYAYGVNYNDLARWEEQNTGRDLQSRRPSPEAEQLELGGSTTHSREL